MHKVETDESSSERAESYLKAHQPKQNSNGLKAQGRVGQDSFLQFMKEKLGTDDDSDISIGIDSVQDFLQWRKVKFTESTKNSS